MKINRSSPQDSPNISNTSETTPKQATSKTSVNPDIQSRWENFVSETASQGGAVDPNALVQYVLRESYVQTTEDLRFFADKVKYFNQTKKEIRDELSKLRDANKDFKAQLDSLKPGKKIDEKVMESLTTAIKESANNSNEDKKHLLGKLKSFDNVAEQLSQQNQLIAEASQRPTVKKKKDDDD